MRGVKHAMQLDRIDPPSGRYREGTTMPLDRRQFIATSAATGLALSGVPFIHAAPKAKQYRTALIGSG